MRAAWRRPSRGPRNTPTTREAPKSTAGRGRAADARVPRRVTPGVQRRTPVVREWDA
jgi:hypothetical protein